MDSTQEIMYIVSPTHAVYKFEKLKDPSFQYEVRGIARTDFEFVEMLEQLTRGASTIDNSRHWEIVKEIFEFLYSRFPEEFVEFKDQMQAIRQTRLNAKGYSKSKEIQYVGALPFRFERMIKKCFPDQQFNKEFIWKLVRKLPILAVSQSDNLIK